MQPGRHAELIIVVLSDCFGGFAIVDQDILGTLNEFVSSAFWDPANIVHSTIIESF